MATAALVIVGNEILGGKYADENGPYVIARLRELGVDLARIVVVRDVRAEIAEEVARCSAAHDHVFTTGGVGPTHDDVTFDGVAQAFGVPVERHEQLADILRAKLGSTANDAAMRMAEIPAGAELWWDGGVIYPAIVVRNVVVLPGVPSLVRLKFEAIAHRFQGVPLISRRLTTLSTEPEIAGALSEAEVQFPSVAIGSYPRFDERPHRVVVTLEGRDLREIDACLEFLHARVDRIAE